MPRRDQDLPIMPRTPKPNPNNPAAALRRIEKDWLRWLLLICPHYITAPFAEHHVAYWEWLWSIKKNVRPRPWISIWSRGGAKSVSAELGTIALGARGIRRYALYVSESQDLADRHLESIAERLESEEMALFYPDMADRAVRKFGHAKGWRRNRLHTRSGFVVDALGLDAASRGMRVDVARPDLLVFDDLDDSLDTPETVSRKIEALTRRILPATTNDAVVLGIQNLIHADSIFARLANNTADFLVDRILSGPIPAIRDLTWETREIDGIPRPVITGGTATWEGQTIEACQNEVDKEGISVFLSELQHQPLAATGGMFDHVSFRHCTPEEVPHLDKIVCWVDPAVTDKKESDSCGIQIDGIARDGTLYRIYSWEHRSGPLEAIKTALREAKRHDAVYVGIETDQGGDTWGPTFREARRMMGPEYAHLTMRHRKAGQGFGSKVHRASQMLADYERGFIVHVYGTHDILERALIRFPKTPPLDLVDASVWAHHDLRVLSRPASYASAVGHSLAGPTSPSSRSPASIMVPSDPRGNLRLVPMPRRP